MSSSNSSSSSTCPSSVCSGPPCCPGSLWPSLTVRSPRPSPPPVFDSAKPFQVEDTAVSSVYFDNEVRCTDVPADPSARSLTRRDRAEPRPVHGPPREDRGRRGDPPAVVRRHGRQADLRTSSRISCLAAEASPLTHPVRRTPPGRAQDAPRRLDGREVGQGAVPDRRAPRQRLHRRAAHDGRDV